MKQALVNDRLTSAARDAPLTATCPDCGGIVKLRSRQGTYFWRHVELPLEGCPPSSHRRTTKGEGDATANHRRPWVRRVGDLVIELHPGEPHLRLRSLSAENTGGPAGLTIAPGEARSLAAALLDAAAELAASETAHHR